MRIGVIALHRLVAFWRPPLLSFRSLQRSLVTSRCSVFHRRELFHFDVCRPCGFSLSEVNRIDLEFPAAWPRDSMAFARSTFTVRCGSCIAAFIPAMFRYPLSDTRDLIEFE
jgi:hypothetical protein